MKEEKKEYQDENLEKALHGVEPDKELDDFNKARESLQRQMDERANGADLNQHSDPDYKGRDAFFGTHRDLGQRNHAPVVLLCLLLTGASCYYGYLLMSGRAVIQDNRIVRTAPQSVPVVIRESAVYDGRLQYMVDLRNTTGAPMTFRLGNMVLITPEGTFYPDEETSKPGAYRSEQTLGAGQTLSLIASFAAKDAPKGSVLRVSFVQDGQILTYQAAADHGAGSR